MEFNSGFKGLIYSVYVDRLYMTSCILLFIFAEEDDYYKDRELRL